MTNNIAWGESSAIQEFPSNISKNMIQVIQCDLLIPQLEVTNKHLKGHLIIPKRSERIPRMIYYLCNLIQKLFVFLRWFYSETLSGVRCTTIFYLMTFKLRLLWNSVFFGGCDDNGFGIWLFSAFWSDIHNRRWMAAWRALVWILSWGEIRWNGSTKRDYLYNMYIYICSSIYIYR